MDKTTIGVKWKTVVTTCSLYINIWNKNTFKTVLCSTHVLYVVLEPFIILSGCLPQVGSGSFNLSVSA